jgi:hypothetical protein
MLISEESYVIDKPKSLKQALELGRVVLFSRYF